MTYTEILSALNLFLTSLIVIHLVWGPKIRAWSLSRPRKSKLEPIKHKPALGPMIPLVVNIGGIYRTGEPRPTVGYYQAKNKPEGEVFVARYYPTPSIDDDVPESDTFVNEQKIQIPGDVFRSRFEMAPVAQVVTHSGSRPSANIQPRAAKQSRTVLKPTKNGDMIRGVPASK